MGNMVFIALIGFVSCCAGMIIGGIFSTLFKNLHPIFIPIIFSLCTGFIVGLVTIDILPESIHIGGYSPTIIGLLLGGFFYKYLHKISHIISINTKDSLLKTGLVMALSISLHNFPSGLALGASANDTFIHSMIMTMILHTIPEGIAIMTPILLAGYSIAALIPISLFVSFPVGLGALLGSTALFEATWVFSILISLSMGIVLFMTIKEIFLESLKKMNVWLCLFFGMSGFLLIVWLSSHHHHM
ncbi:ZIP family metal transporter [Caldalkalibacillus mannanilyticus]|uniref:ZIP family metal transporter n=1 Tax=Caldalkalibacillus mannanilyticus TaxID=1418 RepID=UPI000683F092|nr:ZIP family metal transporter [Caldalkalibacillus mannanilyticus]